MQDPTLEIQCSALKFAIALSLAAPIKEDWMSGEQRRGEGGKFTAKEGSKTSPSETDESANPFQKMGEMLSNLSKGAQDGFRQAFLEKNSGIQAAAKSLSEDCLEGYNAAMNSISDLGKNFKTLGEKVSKTLSNLTKGQSRDFIFGTGIAVAASLGVMNLFFAGTGLLMLPFPELVMVAVEEGGVAFLEIEAMELLGTRLVAIAGKTLWGIVYLGIIVPLLGNMLIANQAESLAKNNDSESFAKNSKKLTEEVKAQFKKLTVEKVEEKDLLELVTDLDEETLDSVAQKARGTGKNPDDQKIRVQLKIQRERLQTYFQKYLESETENQKKIWAGRTRKTAETIKTIINEASK